MEVDESAVEISLHWWWEWKLTLLPSTEASTTIFGGSSRELERASIYPDSLPPTYSPFHECHQLLLAPIGAYCLTSASASFHIYINR